MKYAANNYSLQIFWSEHEQKYCVLSPEFPFNSYYDLDLINAIHELREVIRLQLHDFEEDPIPICHISAHREKYNFPFELNKVTKIKENIYAVLPQIMTKLPNPWKYSLQIFYSPNDKQYCVYTPEFQNLFVKNSNILEAISEMRQAINLQLCAMGMGKEYPIPYDIDSDEFDDCVFPILPYDRINKKYDYNKYVNEFTQTKLDTNLSKSDKETKNSEKRRVSNYR